MTDTDLVNLNLRLQRQLGTPEGFLLQYVSAGAEKTSNPRELTLSALRAFYLALACQSADQHSWEELQTIGLQCCSLLEQQALVIRTALKLPLPMSLNSAPVASAALAPAPIPPVPEVPQPSVTPSEAEEAATSFHQGIMGNFGE